jgi:hypothetical protein
MRHSLGRVVATPPVVAVLPETLLHALLDRHAAGDWGDISADDKASNDLASRHADGRLFSSYATTDHGGVWIITEDQRGESDGPLTTVMFPEDY